jgi:hypothetical protein
MVTVPIPQPGQQAYRARFQESYAEPAAPREYGFAPQSASEPKPEQAPRPATAVTAVSSAQALASALEKQDWITLLAAGSLLAGGVLLVSGHKRSGLVVAAAGTALAMIEEKEAIQLLWKKVPGYVKDAQSFLDKAEGYMNELSAEGEKLHSILR